MIQKRFQYRSSIGVKWTDWFNYSDDDSDFEYLNKNCKYQLNKLKNEFRIIQ